MLSSDEPVIRLRKLWLFDQERRTQRRDRAAALVA